MSMTWLEQLKSTAESVAQTQIQKWIQSHRDELLAAMKEADEVRARAWLMKLCEEFPLAAGIVTMLMRGTPAQAIVNIEKFDPELARTLAQHIGTFEKLHATWSAHAMQ